MTLAMRRLPYCLERTADAVGAVADVLDAAADVIGRDLAVPVDPDDDVAARLRQRAVQSGGNDALRVADQAKIRPALPKLATDDAVPSCESPSATITSIRSSG